MILRRLTEHVRTQNWIAVALDLLIVVVGVFLGIQLGNLNDARIDAIDATMFEERLTEDLEGEISEFDAAINYFADARAAGIRTLARLAGSTEGEHERTALDSRWLLHRVPKSEEGRRYREDLQRSEGVSRDLFLRARPERSGSRGNYGVAPPSIASKRHRMMTWSNSFTPSVNVSLNIL